MKTWCSLLACIIISLVLFQHRIVKSDVKGHALKVTDWDALGYYMYLPGLCIYHDVTELKWFPGIDSQYKVSGGSLYQAGRQDNGKYVFKYLGGVAILQLPFFLIAHTISKSAGYPADGFSPPYQYAIAFGAIIYCIIGIFFLRRFLLLYFKDSTVAITLLLLCLATNFIQYVAIDGGMSHAYIFPLYVFVLWTTYKWHICQRYIWAALTGFIIGLATISRPTEAVMLFIPLLWDTNTKEAAKAKWQLVRQHKKQIYTAALFGLLGILPQLIYWKIATGSFIYDVGSKWDFLTPHLRVLTGWEKGWFIYTPVTICFVLGLFFVWRFPFRKSVIYFCLLNIYIIISWADWRYGGSYSTRALVQSYPVFALPFAAFVDKVNTGKVRFVVYAAGIYLIAVNLFQLKQYATTILHYNDMNRKYYAHIYLNNTPSPLDMSLLDTDEFLNDTAAYKKKILIQQNELGIVNFTIGSHADISISPLALADNKDCWLKIDADIKSINGFYSTYLNASLSDAGTIKQSKIRLFNAICKDGEVNHYAFYIQVPNGSGNAKLNLFLDGAGDFNGEVRSVTITEFCK